MSRPSTSTRLLLLDTCLLVAALVLVPTVLRAVQTPGFAGNIRLSIRLNWNADHPPTKTVVAPPTTAQPETVWTTESVSLPAWHSVSCEHDAVPRAPDDVGPDPVRGPPSLTLA